MVDLPRRNGHPATISSTTVSSSIDQLEELWTTSIFAHESSFDEDTRMIGIHRNLYATSTQRGLDGLSWILDQNITPCRLHTSTVMSRLIFTVLTTGILLRPGELIPESESQATRLSLRFGDIVWLCFSIGNLLELIFPLPKHPRSRALFLPTLSLLLLPFAGLRIYAYPLLTISVPFLFFSLLTPASPSFAHMFPNVYLPFTTFASSVVSRSFGPMILLAPLGLLVFVALAMGLNGDLWRIGLSLVSLFTIETSSRIGPARETPNKGSKPTPTPSPTPTPADPGIAPFSIRLWLSITLVAIMWVMLIVGCARGMTAGRTGDQYPSSFSSEWNDDDRHIEDQEVEDLWVKEWGKEVGLEARRIRKQTIERWSPSLQSRRSRHPDSRFDTDEEGETDEEAEMLSAGEARRQGDLMVRLPSPLNALPLVLYSIPSFLLSTLRFINPSKHAQLRQPLDNWGRLCESVLLRLLGGIGFGWWDGAWWVWGKIRRRDAERAGGEIRLRRDRSEM